LAKETIRHRLGSRRRRRRRAVVLGLLLACAAAAIAVAASPSASRRPANHPGKGGQRRPAGGPPYPVGLYVARYTEPGKTVTYATGETAPRSLLTYIRYPALRSGLDAPPAPGSFPLVIFGHGFAKAPSFYAPLLSRIAAAGFIVASPLFPLENPEAPGGPLRSDLPNEPADVVFLHSRLLAEAENQSSPLYRLIDPQAVALAGQSDGGDVALTVAYGAEEANPWVKAVVVWSGAQLPGATYSWHAGEPPLLATQGTADPINLPAETTAFFKGAAPPKYLVWLTGAGHLGPYSGQPPYSEVVAQSTICFLRLYLLGRCSAQRLAQLADRPGISYLEGSR